MNNKLKVRPASGEKDVAAARPATTAAIEVAGKVELSASCTGGILALMPGTICSSKCSMAMEEMSRSSWSSSWERGGLEQVRIFRSTWYISSSTYTDTDGNHDICKPFNYM